MATAFIGIGIPGSGKTTVLKQAALNRGITYISKDDIREELLGNAEDQSQNRRVWHESLLRTNEALALGNDVIIDATNVEAWKRQELIKELRSSGASRIVGLYFNTKLSVARERNQKRVRVVPDDVLSWMQQKLDEAPPSLEEGFDDILKGEEIEKVFT